MLSLEGITKIFGGHIALEDVSLSVNQGSITGIIGPNGAGENFALQHRQRSLYPNLRTGLSWG